MSEEQQYNIIRVPLPVFDQVKKMRAWIATNPRVRDMLKALVDGIYRTRTCPICNSKMELKKSKGDEWLFCNSCGFKCPVIHDWMRIENLGLGKVIGLLVLAASVLLKKGKSVTR